MGVAKNKEWSKWNFGVDNYQSLYKIIYSIVKYDIFPEKINRNMHFKEFSYDDTVGQSQWLRGNYHESINAKTKEGFFPCKDHKSLMGFYCGSLPWSEPVTQICYHVL